MTAERCWGGSGRSARGWFRRSTALRMGKALFLRSRSTRRHEGNIFMCVRFLVSLFKVWIESTTTIATFGICLFCLGKCQWHERVRIWIFRVMGRGVTEKICRVLATWLSWWRLNGSNICRTCRTCVACSWRVSVIDPSTNGSTTNVWIDQLIDGPLPPSSVLERILRSVSSSHVTI